MYFEKGLSHEQMIDIMNGKNQVTSGVAAPAVFTVRQDTNHMYANKNIFQIYPEIVPVQCIAIDPETSEWVLVPVNNEAYDLPCFLTMEEAIAETKARSKFWEVTGFNHIIGWDASEAEIIEMRNSFDNTNMSSKVVGSTELELYKASFEEFLASTSSFSDKYKEFNEKLSREVAMFIMGVDEK